MAIKPKEKAFSENILILMHCQKVPNKIKHWGRWSETVDVKLQEIAFLFEQDCEIYYRLK